MTDQSSIITQTFDRSPEEVFTAVCDVRGWWSKNINGNTAQDGEEFDYEVPGVHRSRMRLIEVVPEERVVWQVVENHFSFVQDQQEWDGTKVRFDIAPQPDGRTQLRFEHEGLVPAFECFEICHKSWSFYVGHSLAQLINTGKGQPNEPADDADVIGARMDEVLA